MRGLCSDVRLHTQGFIQPLFVDQSLTSPRPAAGLTGVRIDTLESVLETVALDLAAGVEKFLIFPVPSKSSSDDFDFSFGSSIISGLRSAFGESVWLAADLCLCSYTLHGHCGILNEDGSRLMNAETVRVLADYASVLAHAGVDCIAPSDMTDGRVASIRRRLDAEGYDHVSIMSYAAKFASQFYGPFRDACHSAPVGAGLRDRRTYQISPLHGGDAVDTALRDLSEGADILMVKPAALYTDIIASIRRETLAPIAAYHVSGEYAALEGLVREGLADRATAHLEVWTALQRSGAGIIISYAARHAKAWIQNHIP